MEPNINQIGRVRKALPPGGESVLVASKRPAACARRVKPACKFGVGPLGEPFVNPVQDQPMIVLESDTREWRLKMRLPRAIADGIQSLLCFLSERAWRAEAAAGRGTPSKGLIPNSKSARMARQSPILL